MLAGVSCPAFSGHIPCAAGLPRLLAAWLALVARVVLGPYDDRLRRRLAVERVRDVECERGLPACVVSDVLAVDPDVTMVQADAYTVLSTR